MKKLIFRIHNKIYKFLKIEAKSTRAYFLKSISVDASILEIGPFCNPVCTGPNVKYFDILNQEELITRAGEIGYSIAPKQVPYIEYVSKTGDLSIINEKFDIVISCHAIEHQLDLIEHLVKVSNLLKETGSYYAIIPDKRYCFDHFNNLSTIADIIGGSYEKRERHSIKSVIEHRALTAHNSAKNHWRGKHGETNSTNTETLKKAIADYNTGKYIDVHAWYFTPNSFEEIITLLNKLDYIDLVVDKIYPTRKGTFEFFVSLKKGKLQ